MTSVHESPFVLAQSPLHVDVIAIGERCANSVTASPSGTSATLPPP